jgi:hypothetical protein
MFCLKKIFIRESAKQIEKYFLRLALDVQTRLESAKNMEIMQRFRVELQHLQT